MTISSQLEARRYRRIQAAALTILCFCAGAPACAADIYVDGSKGLQSNPGTAASPYRYVWQAMQAANPGDTIHLEPSTVFSQVSFTKSGTAAAPIHLVGDGISPALTQVTGAGSNFGVWIDANYVSVSNLDVTAPGNWAGIFVAPSHHHVAIYGNNVHGAGLDGISTVNADWISITDNVVYGNATYTAANTFGSGISVFESINSDTSTGTKIFIEGNLVYANTNRPRCRSGCTNPDGSGIIIDDGRHSESDGVAYNGRVQISNNVAFGNGGRGVHIYESDHITVTQNTTYFNNQDPYEGNYRPGEVTVDTGSDIQITNNVLYTDGLEGINDGQYTGTHVGISVQSCTSGTIGVTASNNDVYTTSDNIAQLSFARLNTIPVTIVNNIWGDPLFVDPSLDPATANFDILPGSAAMTSSGNLGAYQ